MVDKDAANIAIYRHIRGKIMSAAPKQSSFLYVSLSHSPRLPWKDAIVLICVPLAVVRNSGPGQQSLLGVFDSLSVIYIYIIANNRKRIFYFSDISQNHGAF